MIDNPNKPERGRRKHGETSVEILTPEQMKAFEEHGERKLAGAAAKLRALEAAGTMGEILNRYWAARIARRDRKQDWLENLTRESERPIWEAIRDALHLYHLPGNSQSFPAEMALYLEDEINTLLTGNQPFSLKALLKKGRQDRPDQIEAKRCAVRYIKACEEFPIKSDSRPVRTIADWYGVTDSTVHKWKKDARLQDLKLDDFGPELDQESRARRIVNETRRDGERYRYLSEQKRWNRQKTRKS